MKPLEYLLRKVLPEKLSDKIFGAREPGRGTVEVHRLHDTLDVEHPHRSTNEEPWHRPGAALDTPRPASPLEHEE